MCVASIAGYLTFQSSVVRNIGRLDVRNVPAVPATSSFFYPRIGNKPSHNLQLSVLEIFRLHEKLNKGINHAKWCRQWSSGMATLRTIPGHLLESNMLPELLY